jgi:hypothetical protein
MDTTTEEAPGPPMPDMAVRACSPFEAICVPPSGYLAEGTTDAGGRLTFRLPTNQTGSRWYFELTTGWATGAKKLLYPTGRPLQWDTTIVLPVPHAKQLWGTPGSSFDNAGPATPDRGAVEVVVRGCDAYPPSRLEFEVDGTRGPGASTYYLNQFGGTVPLGPGSFGAFMGGVEPGVRTITARRSGGSVVAMEKVAVQAGAITILHFLPPSDASLSAP